MLPVVDIFFMRVNNVFFFFLNNVKKMSHILFYCHIFQTMLNSSNV